MTEKFFRVHGIKKEEAKAPWNKGKGLACLMHFPIPDWAVEEKQEGEIAESLWNHFYQWRRRERGNQDREGDR